jgi:hypothetical protein
MIGFSDMFNSSLHVYWGGVEHLRITAHVFDQSLLIISITFCMTLKHKFHLLIPSCPPFSSGKWRQGQQQQWFAKLLFLRSRPVSLALTSHPPLLHVANCLSSGELMTEIDAEATTETETKTKTGENSTVETASSRRRPPPF